MEETRTNGPSQLIQRCRDLQAKDTLIQLEYGEVHNRVIGKITDVNPDYLEFAQFGTDRTFIVPWVNVDNITVLPETASAASFAK